MVRSPGFPGTCQGQRWREEVVIGGGRLGLGRGAAHLGSDGASRLEPPGAEGLG